MTVVTESNKAHRMNSNCLKSRLALALGARGNLKNSPETTRGDYKKLEDILQKQNSLLPLTVTLKRFNKESMNRENGLCTIQTSRKLTKLKCITTNGETVIIPSDIKTKVKFLSIDNTTVYTTIGQLRSKRREHNIEWFTTTTQFTVNNNTYKTGQIFSFAASTILASFKRDRNVRGVTICQYPGRKKIYVPLDTEGYFKKM